MTTNTYQALCDDVGIEPKEILTCETCGSLMMELHPYGDLWCNKCTNNRDYTTTLHYPPQSAEQRERLEELITSKLFYITYRLERMTDKTFKYEAGGYERDDGFLEYESGYFTNRPEALYALTHKLRKEGVLSKEEVKEALNGNN